MAQLEPILVNGILDSLEDLGYVGPLSEKVAIQFAIESGLDSTEFINLVNMLCSELKTHLSLNESVTCPTGPEDAESFHLEVRSFLSELNCPHPSLVQDLNALSQPGNRLLFIDFLTSELMAARLISLRKQKQTLEKEEDIPESNPYDVPSNLASILKVYGIGKPPSHITITMIFDKIITKTKELVASCPKGHITPSLVTQSLSTDQWGTLDRINEALTKEYALRRRMLLTRCNVTVKSFKWSHKTKEKNEEFTTVYQNKWKLMTEKAPVLIARVLASTQDLLSVQRTSYGDVRKNTQCEINKVIIGSVPDRGGRPNETRPPPEMPSFRKRTEAAKDKRDGGRGGKRGGRGGGRVQGGWSGGSGGGYGGYREGGGASYQGDWGGGQSGYQQGGYQYGGYQHGGYQQAGYQHGGYQHVGYQQGGYQQGGYQHGGYQQGGYQQGGYQQGEYQQGGYQHGGYQRGRGGGGNWRGGGGGGQQYQDNNEQYYYS